ncbi:MAG: PKD domain-containing protein [Thaumarchaeota archaeon]|nr:PKD domain-containing protein [Nitrososphaerota archaeon]
MRISSTFCATLVTIITVFGFSLLVLIPQNASADITNFTFTPTTGDSPLSVFFQVTSTGKVNTVEWNFGDGSGTTTNTSLNATHVYQSAGNYTGTVEVTTSDHQTASESFRISVTGTIGANVGNVSSINPDNNGAITAYQYLQQEHNGSLISSSLPPLSVQTDALSYNQGDTITIHGVVKNVSNQTAVTLRVINSLKNLVSIAQLIPGSDGSFSKMVVATGPLWTKAGNYTVIAQYGPTTNATTSFSYGGGDGSSKLSSPPTSSTFTLQTSAGSFNIPYTIRGGTVQNMQLDGQNHILTVTINAPSDGSLSIDIPRAMIDSKQQLTVPTGPNQTSTTQISQSELPDQAFTVQVGGQNAQVTETKDPNSRTLGISFHKGDTTINIMGTVSVPEFGPIAALVLAIAIVSIIAVSAKTGLRFMPKY